MLTENDSEQIVRLTVFWNAGSFMIFIEMYTINDYKEKMIALKSFHFHHRVRLIIMNLGVKYFVR